MKFSIIFLSFIGSVLLAAGAPLFYGEGTEDQQIGILQSNASLQQKDAACARLKRIGTARSVPALAALLTDKDLSHSARYALESMPCPEAGQALLEALNKATGLNRVGIITSLGNRREASAEGRLAALLNNEEASTRVAAAFALGRIAGPGAVKSLQAAFGVTTDATRQAVVDALLACGNQFIVDGNNEAAAAIFKQLYERKERFAQKPALYEKDYVRTAAYEGMIRAAGPKSLSLVLAGITGEDPAAQMAALQLARDVKDPAATKALADLLAKSKPALQIALIESLAQRGDSAAASAVAVLAKSRDGDVRVSALNALGILGDASVVPLLVTSLTGASEPAEQKAAQLALLQLQRGNVTDALVAQLTGSSAAVQAEVVGLLAGRGEKSTIPKLLELARSGAEAAQKASLQALGKLVEPQHLGALVQLVLEAKTEPVRSGAADALGGIYQRAQGKDLDVTPVIQGLSRGNAEARAALLGGCGMLVDARIRAALRETANGPAGEVRTAAIGALCNSRDVELLPDIIALGMKTGDVPVRSQAIRGAVHLVTEEQARLSTAQRIQALKQLLAVASRKEDKWSLLPGLAVIPDAASLELVLPMLKQPEVQAEAALAVTQIASAIRGSNPELAKSALQKVVSTTTDPTRRQAAQSILDQIEGIAGYVTAWQMAGPYEENGKNYDALFDIVFPPERAEATKVAWRLLPASTDPKNPWLLDLLKALGGEQRVAYARTRIYSDTEQPARLELGTDDGVKAWLNGKLVHSKNIARPLAVGSDKVNVTLKQGWNVLLLKVTQNNLGWEFCARLVKPDGSRLPGLRSDTNFAP